MTFLRSAIAMLAAGALSLGLVSGVVAQDEDEDSEQGEIETSADLIIMQEACFVDITGGDGSFGTFMWDADEGEFQSEGSGSTEVSGFLGDEEGQLGCAVSMSGVDLSFDPGDGTVSTIPAGSISVTVTVPNDGQTFFLDDGATLGGVDTGDAFTVEMTLDPAGLGPEDVSLGVHTGTVTFTAGPDPDAGDPVPGD